MAYKATNNARSTLAVGLGGTVSDTTLQIDVDDVALFPVINDGGVGDDYTLLTLTDGALNKEIVKVTRHDTGSASFTIVRAQEGTSARVWQIGDSVSLRLTAGVVTQTYTHPTQNTGAHAASAISLAPTGGIAATNVQAAIAELESEKASSGHSHPATAISHYPSGVIPSSSVGAALALIGGATGASAVGYGSASVGAVLGSLVRSPLQYGVAVTSTTIQAAIDAGDGIVDLPAGVITLSATLILKAGVTLRGKGKGVTVLTQADGANIDIIKTEGYGTFAALTDAGVPHDFAVLDLTIDGNYLDSVWNSATNTINNSSGYGIKCEGYGFNIDVELYNIPGVGLRCAGEGSVPAGQDIHSTVSVVGRVFGKEGIIWTGPGDCVLQKAWIGLAGILPMPAAQTTRATSTEYSGQSVDGIVFDGVTVEIGRVHVYATWSGVGFRTRNTVRLEGDHLISESNNAQVWLSEGTYGAISTISLRNLSLFHPSWSAATPTYVGNEAYWDAMTCNASCFSCGNLRIQRTVTVKTRVAGTRGMVVTGDANKFGLVYRNGSPTDAADAEYGGRYSGQPFVVGGNGNNISAAIYNPRGIGCSVVGNQNTVTASITSPVGHGIRASGAQNIINAVCNGQVTDGGSGASFVNDGSNNVWNTTGSANAVPYASGTGLSRVAGANINGSTRSFSVASGVITVTTFDDRIVIDTEGATATDDLDTINGGAIHQRLTVQTSNSGRDVTVKDGTGNLRLSGDFVLSHPQDRLLVEYDGSAWVEISRSDNTA